MVRQNSQLKEWNKYDIIEMNRWFYPNIEYNKLTYAIKLPASIIFYTSGKIRGWTMCNDKDIGMTRCVDIYCNLYGRCR